MHECEKISCFRGWKMTWKLSFPGGDGRRRNIETKQSLWIVEPTKDSRLRTFIKSSFRYFYLLKIHRKRFTQFTANHFTNLHFQPHEEFYFSIIISRRNDKLFAFTHPENVHLYDNRTL